MQAVTAMLRIRVGHSLKKSPRTSQGIKNGLKSLFELPIKRDKKK